MPDWKQYSDDLRCQIEEDGSNVILRAEDFCAECEHGDEEPALFALASGRYVSEFVSLWQLFDQERFDELGDRLAEKILEIQRSTAFDAIVTCTITARHLLNSVHPKIESDTRTVPVYDLGPYPSMIRNSAAQANLQGKKVLIVTDVVASGRLIVQMTRSLLDLKINVAGTLAVIVTNQRIIDEITDSNGEKPSNLSRTTEYLRVGATSYFLHCLTEREIRSFNRDQILHVAPDRITRIDPVTVYPEERALHPGNQNPLFSIQEMIDHFEATNAVDVDFFSTEERKFMTAVRITRLLFDKGRGNLGNLIWNRLKRHFPRSDDYAIVSTYDGRDMAFKRFVSERLHAGHDRFVMAARREEGTGSHRFFLLRPDADKLVGKKHIYLLLASAHTSEALRELIATIVMHSAPKKLTVVCLLNRMGNWTNDFMTRIQRLLSGTNGSSRGTVFKFVPVYNLPDFSRNDIVNIHDEIEKLLTEYSYRATTPLLKQLSEQDKKHFRYHAMTAREFVHPLDDEDLKEECAIQVGTETAIARKSKTKQLLISAHLMMARDDQPVLDELQTETRKGRLFFYYALLLGNVGYLNLTGRISSVRETLIRRVDEEGLRRIALASSMTQLELEGSVETESHLVFGLALLSHYDSEGGYEDFVEKRITGGVSADEWLKNPEAFIAYYTSERWLLTTSMLATFAQHSLLPDERVVHNRELVGSVRAILGIADRLVDEANSISNREARDRRLTSLNYARSHLHMLSRELGPKRRVARFQSIRFLHSKIVNYPERHSPISEGLTVALDHIDAAFNAAKPSAGENLSSLDRLRLGDFLKPHRVEQGMSAASSLEEIASRLRELLEDRDVTTTAQMFQRFGAPITDDGFSKDVDSIMRLLLQVRSDRSISRAERQELRDLWSKVRHDLFEEGPLRKLLMSFIVPLKQTLAEMMKEANVTLGRRRFVTRWPEDLITDLQEPAQEKYVLGDPDLLAQILKNLCTNVRYQEEVGATDGAAKMRVAFSDPKDELNGSGEYIQMVRLTITSWGRSYDEGHTDERVRTIVRQGHDLEPYGGKLEVHGLDEGEGAEATLTLIARDLPKDAATGSAEDKGG